MSQPSPIVRHGKTGAQGRSYPMSVRSMALPAPEVVDPRGPAEEGRRYPEKTCDDRKSPCPRARTGDICPISSISPKATKTLHTLASSLSALKMTDACSPQPPVLRELTASAPIPYPTGS
jgi:hypothetical protein